MPNTVPLVLDALGGRKADLVICDGAPDGECLDCVGCLVLFGSSVSGYLASVAGSWHSTRWLADLAQLERMRHHTHTTPGITTYIAVTGVHDLDAYLHSQLILAVSQCCALV